MRDYHKVTLDKKKTGINIRQAIINSNLSIEEVANNLELSSPRVLYEWFNGKKLPNLENLMNLAIMLSIQVENIIALQ